MAQIKVKMQVLHHGEIALGPGKADLLAAIDRVGSISGAGRELGLSYRRTRDMVDTLNRCWKGPLVETARGGSGHGGARLTDLGHDVLHIYRSATIDIDAAAEKHRDALLALIAK